MRITGRQRRLYIRYKVRRDRLTDRFKQRSPAVGLRTFAGRDNRLRSEGFLAWERFWLDQHSISSPAMRAMRDARLKSFKAFGVKFDNFNEYRRKVSALYRKNGWTFRDGRLSPFKMVEDYIRQGNYPDTPQPVRRKAKRHPTKVQREAARHPILIPGHAEFQRQQRLR